MNLAYTKLFNTIVGSSIWAQPDSIRVVWVTMMAVADAHGEVHLSIDGLAHMARVSEETALKALEVFKAPDAKSRTKDNDGRRIEEIDGGWVLLNHDKYRDLLSEEDKRAKAAARQARYRERKRLRDAQLLGQNAPLDTSLGASATSGPPKPLKLSEKPPVPMSSHKSLAPHEWTDEEVSILETKGLNPTETMTACRKWYLDNHSTEPTRSAVAAWARKARPARGSQEHSKAVAKVGKESEEKAKQRHEGAFMDDKLQAEHDAKIQRALDARKTLNAKRIAEAAKKVSA